MHWSRASHRHLSAAEFHDLGLIHLLPWIGSDEARSLAKAIAKGAAGDYRTAAAQDALQSRPQP